MKPPVRIRHSSIGQSAWESATMPVPPLLRLHVRSWIGTSETSTARCRHREMPGPQVILLFQFGLPVRISGYGAGARHSDHRHGLVAGLYDSFVTVEHDGYDACVQVNLTPLGARALLGLPLTEISGTVVDLSDLLPNARNLSDRLASTTSWAERFRLVEAVLLERLLLRANVRLDIAWAVKQIDASGGLTKIGALASALHMSRKHLHALFRDHVGMPPKLYANLVRFDRLNLRILASADSKWADLALESGFADQAHMGREVRRFSGLSPTALRAYLAEMASLCGEDVLAQVSVEPGVASSTQSARRELANLVGLAR